MRILTSMAGECPRERAFLVAISAEMAISPASCFWRPGLAGNESTSVGLSFPRKRRFRDFISALVVISTLTAPFNPAERRVRGSKPSNARSGMGASGLLWMINDGSTPCPPHAILLEHIRYL